MVRLLPAACFLLFSVQTRGAIFSVQDLGSMPDLPDRTDSRPNGINENGIVAGSILTNGAYRAALYSGDWEELGTLGGNESLGSDVNDSGLAAGTSRNSIGASRAFLWTPGGTDGVSGNPQMKDLGTLGGTHSEGYAINAGGEISGYAQTGTEDHAFVFAADTMTDIGALLGNALPNSYGLSINDAGQVAGIAYNSGFAAAHAFFYDGENAVNIGTLGGVRASALALNNAGQVAGYADLTNGLEHAFRYANGVMTDLGTLGGNYSYAIGINNSNVVVGGSFIDPADSVYHAFMTVADSMVDLNEQLDATGAGWTLVEARAINDAGQIAGIGTFNGTAHGFLLTPASTVATPAIDAIRLEGPDVLIRFASEAGVNYSLQARTNLALGAWQTVAPGINGTGSTITVTNSGGAGLPQNFYRIEATAPQPQ